MFDRSVKRPVQQLLMRQLGIAVSAGGDRMGAVCASPIPAGQQPPGGGH